MARRVSLNKSEEAIQVIKEDGGVILTGFATESDIKTVTADAQPYLDAITTERKSRDSNPAPETIRCNLLFGRSTTAREVWLQQPALLQIVNYFLRTVSTPYNDANNLSIETDAILSASSTLNLVSGVKAQTLHRDDFIWQQSHKRNHDSSEYVMGQDVCIGLLVPAVDTCTANGATLFVPKSHLWDHSHRPRTEEVVSAELKVGEAFLFLGSTVHAGGGNTTSQSRPVHGFFFCRSWIKPEENMHLWYTKEEVSKWSLGAQKQAGYVLENPYLGHCNEKNPVDLFRVSEKHLHL